jgi:hypothetical protein
MSRNVSLVNGQTDRLALPYMPCIQLMPNDKHKQLMRSSVKKIHMHTYTLHVLTFEYLYFLKRSRHFVFLYTGNFSAASLLTEMSNAEKEQKIDKYGSSEVLSSKRSLWKIDLAAAWAIMDCNRQYEYIVE